MAQRAVVSIDVCLVDDLIYLLVSYEGVKIYEFELGSIVLLKWNLAYLFKSTN
jgi:hypothetical protein